MDALMLLYVRQLFKRLVAVVARVLADVAVYERVPVSYTHLTLPTILRV